MLWHGGHGAFRLGLVRFGWIRSGKAVEFRSVELGSDQAVEARIDLFWSGAFRFGRARFGKAV